MIDPSLIFEDGALPAMPQINDLEQHGALLGLQWYQLPPVSYQMPVHDMLFDQHPLQTYEFNQQPFQTYQPPGFGMLDEPLRPDEPEYGQLPMGITPLAVGQICCAQAADGRWWDVEVFHDNRDFTYVVLVKDDVHTSWPQCHRASMLDRSCDEFYRTKMLEDKQQEHQQEHHQEHPQGQQQEESDDLPPVDQQQADQPQIGQQQEDLPVAQNADTPERWPSTFKKSQLPWRQLSAIAAAGSVPLLYHLTGAAGVSA